MSSQINFVTELLSGFIEEKSELDEQIKKTGFVPKKMCEMCNVENKRVIVDFSPKEDVVKFIEWLNKFQVLSLRKEPYSEFYYIKTSKKIGRIRNYEEDDSGFIYQFRQYDDTSAIVKNLFDKNYKRTFFSKYEIIETCPHFTLNNPSVLKLKYNKRFRPMISNSQYKLVLCCEDCKNIYENSMCDSIRAKPFYYDFSCNTSDILLQTKLKEKDIDIKKYEQSYKYEERTSDTSFFIKSGTYYSGKYYIPDHSILISLNERYGLDDFLTYLDPEMLVILFASEKSLPSYLKYNKNTLFVNENGMFLFDKDKKIETSIEVICDSIILNLNSRIEDQRGNDHDRTILALNALGQEMGFVTQTEFSQSGVRIDLVWYDREGNIKVAGEVETSSTWKKDLISTWEVEPELAIIVGFTKTTKVVQNLMNLTLMKYVPHPVLYINKFLDEGYLFEKQEIVKHYELSKEIDEQKDSIKVL